MRLAAFKLPIKTKFIMRLKRSMCGYASSQDFKARNLSDEELAQAIIDVRSNYFSCGCKSHPAIRNRTSLSTISTGWPNC